MPLNKALGPDGFLVEFFKESWSVIGEGVVAAIKGFFLLLVCYLKKLIPLFLPWFLRR
jgi:hypothetical protein